MATKRRLTERQQAFVDYYVETMNAAEAARRAGYSAKNARQTGSDLLKKDYIQEAIKERLDEIASKRIADSTEVMEFITSVLRGENESEVLAGDGCGGSVRMKKKPDCKERLKAAELLGKRYGLFNGNDNVAQQDIKIEIVASTVEDVDNDD